MYLYANALPNLHVTKYFQIYVKSNVHLKSPSFIDYRDRFLNVIIILKYEICSFFFLMYHQNKQNVIMSVDAVLLC